MWRTGNGLNVGPRTAPRRTGFYAQAQGATRGTGEIRTQTRPPGEISRCTAVVSTRQLSSTSCTPHESHTLDTQQKTTRLTTTHTQVLVRALGAPCRTLGRQRYGHTQVHAICVCTALGVAIGSTAARGSTGRDDCVSLTLLIRPASLPRIRWAEAGCEGWRL